MKAWYTDRFVLPLPEGHRFPMEKYSLLRERALAEGLVAPDRLLVPEAATDEELAQLAGEITESAHAMLTRGI